MAERDMAEKSLEDYNDVFSDIVNVLLFNGNEKLKEEVLQLMSVLTNDRRFEEAVNDVENVGKGAEPKNMSEVLDRVEKRGENRGDIKRAKADAMRMKKDGVPLDKIALYVNIDINTAKQWTEQDGNNDIPEECLDDVANTSSL